MGISSPAYFKNLDAIRFIAAMMVLMGHVVRPVYDRLNISSVFLLDLFQTFCNGELGVSVFFVLSGFLITYLLIKEHQTDGRVNLRKFYIRRMLRIWPLYFLIVGFTFGMYPFIKTLLQVNNPLASDFKMHLFFLSNFDVIRIQKFFTGSDALSQNITWSVSIEEQFYLFWPLLFVFLSRRYWLFAIIAVLFLSMSFRLIQQSDKTVLYYHTFSVLVDLATGGLSAYLVLNSAPYRRFFEDSGPAKLVAFMLVAFCCVFISPRVYTLPYGVALSRLAIAISFALVITSQALTTCSCRAELSRWRFASRWGIYTYGIYLIHPIVITLSTAALRELLNPPALTLDILVAVLTFPLTFLLSYLSFRYYERWFLRLKNRFEVIRTPY